MRSMLVSSDCAFTTHRFFLLILENWLCGVAARLEPPPLARSGKEVKKGTRRSLGAFGARAHRSG